MSTDINYLICMIPAIILMMIAQFYVSSTYGKWSKVRNQRNISGAEAAQMLMRSSGLNDVRLEGVAGNLTDHYEPGKNVLRLSAGVAQNPSVAALAITAHELGHALQDHQNYLPLRFRAALVPMVNIGSYLGWILIVAGMIFQMANLSWLGVAFFSGGALFALATLPVELNASKRARIMLKDSGLVTSGEEMRGVSSVLNAAAMTYVAALFQAVMQLLYFISMVGGKRRS